MRRAGSHLVRPTVPPLASRQVHERTTFGVHDGHDEQVRPEQVFVVDDDGNGVVRVLEQQRADDRYAGRGGFLRERVDVGEKAVAELGERAHNLDGLVAVVPWLAAAHAVKAGV